MGQFGSSWSGLLEGTHRPSQLHRHGPWAGRCHYDEQVYGGETGGKERQSGSCAVVRGRSEETTVVKNGLMLVAYLPPRSGVTSGPELLPRTMSGSVVLSQLGSLLMSMAHVVTKTMGVPRVWATTCSKFDV